MKRALSLWWWFVLFLALTAVSKAAEPELKVAIVIPHGAPGMPTRDSPVPPDPPGRLNWEDADRGAHFHILLTNVSTAEAYFPAKEGSVFFELTDENGHTSRVVHLPYYSNHTAIWALQPQESGIIDVYFTDREAWGDGFWPGPGHPKGRYTLKAYYEASQDDFPHKFHVWTGLIESSPVTCIIK